MNRPSMTSLRTISAVCLIVMPALILGGCDSSQDAKPTAPTIQSLSIAYPKDTGCNEAWEPILNEWSARTGISHTRIETELPGDPSQPLFADLNIVPLTSTVDLAYHHQIRPIPNEALEERALDWQGLFQGIREKVCTLSGTRTIIPLGSPALVLYYRADLLTNAKRSPPETWDDYLKLVQELPDWAPNLKAVEPWQGDWAATLYLARTASYAKHPDHTAFLFDLETGDPLIDSPGFQKAWDIHKQIAKELSPDILKLTPAHCRQEILEGRAALAIALESPSILRVSSEDLSPSTEIQRAADIQLGFTQLPGSAESYNPSLKNWEPPRESPVHRVTLTAFDGLAAVASDKLSDEAALLAWNMLQTLTLDDDAILPPRIVSPVRESDLATLDLFTAPPLIPSEQGEYLATVGRSLRNRQLTQEMPVVGRQEFLSALTEAVQQGLTQQDLSGADFTQTIAQRWSEIQKSVGKEAVRDSYRISHGLKPLTSNTTAQK